jgi:ABC-type branched-subunit amino acid transport system permease subunit
MMAARMRRFTDLVREGFWHGFVAGIAVLFLILIGVPIQVQSLALFALLLIMVIFGVVLARRLRELSVGHLLLNALTMGITAALMVFLFLSLINSWQAKGIDVRQYFDSITTETMSMLSGVPEDELHPNPVKNPLTGEYPSDAEFRTDPMRLSFDSDTGLQLQIGLTGEAWTTINLGIGGLYGFFLLLIGCGLVGAMLTWAAIYADLARYWERFKKQSTGNPVSHWAFLLLPVIFFGLLWMTEGQSDSDPVLDVGSGATEVQLLIGFGIILWGLVAVRAAQPRDWGLEYPVRLAICAGGIGLLMAVGIWRIVGNNVYFIAPSGSPGGSETLSILVVLGIGAVMIGHSALTLRDPSRFEIQLAATLALGAVLLMPMYFDQYQNDVMTQVGINILLGLGLNIVVGYAGLLDLGYVAFFALGAYAYAFLGSNQRLYDDTTGEATGFKFAGNDATMIRLTGWVITTVIVATLVIIAGLYLWRRWQARHGAGRSAVMPRSPLFALPDRPSNRLTFLIALVAIEASLLVSLVLGSLDLYRELFGSMSPFWIGLIVGVLVAGLSGIMLGIPVLRLRGDYLAIVTLGFGEIIRLLFNNLRDFTGGPQGVLQIPRPLPEGASGTVTYLSIIYLVFIGAGVVAFFSARLKQSRTGRAWSAMKSDEDIAQSMGINLVQSKLTAFAIGAAFAGIGGGP